MQDDLIALRDFAQQAEGLGLTHLRIPDQVLRPGSGYVHEPLTLLAYIAAITETIELVPSVIILPSRQTALFAKQAAELDVLSEGRLRLGIGVGNSEAEYQVMGVDFHTRGQRCDEQLELLTQLWTQETVEFSGRWDQVSGAGINPLPVQQPIPIWIGARAIPSSNIIRRIGSRANGWFVLCSPEEFPQISGQIHAEAMQAGRNPEEIGTEAGVAVVGPREAEWQSRVSGWQSMGLSHLCLRTLGGNLSVNQHLRKLKQVVGELPD
jgi:probable F420-dependent oxidoreductase